MTKNNWFGISKIFAHSFVVILLYLAAFTSDAHALIGSMALQEPGTIAGCNNGENSYAFSTIGLFGIQPKEGWNSICLPDNDYKYCGALADCKFLSPQEDCAVLSNVKDSSKFGLMCVNAQLTVKAGSSDGCDNSDSCPANHQCIRVGVLDSSKTYQHATRCISVDELVPISVLDKAQCNRKESPCAAGSICINNTYSPEHFRYTCLKTEDTTTDTCPQDNSAVGKACGDVKNNTFCMRQRLPGSVTTVNGKPFISAGKSQYVCVKVDKLDGGPGAPTDYACNKSDTDCKDPLYPYCLTNPETKKNQCFSQKNIYTQMKTIGDEKPKCSDGTTEIECFCKEEGLNACMTGIPSHLSICAKYFSGSQVLFACIKNVAIGSGLATIIAPPTVAEERTERFAPKLQVEIPGLNFTNTIYGEANDEGRVFAIPFLAQYINAVYKYAIGFGILLAVVMLMYAGLRWMTSFGDMSQVSDAKNMVGNAVLGLVLLMSAYTILYVINPDLIQLKSIEITAPTQQVADFSDLNEVPSESDQDSGALGKPKRLCSSKDSCLAFCNDPSKIPPTTEGMADPKELVDVESYFKNKKIPKDGLVIRKGALVRMAVLQPLVNAGKAAKAEGYVIHVQGTYRSLKSQFALACAKFEGGSFNSNTLSWPGGSHHGNGIALDVTLKKDGKVVGGWEAAGGKASSPPSIGDPFLKKFMQGAGFVRLKSESWHFEYYSNGGYDTSSRCANC